MTYRELLEKQTITEQDLYEMSVAIAVIESGQYLNEGVLEDLTGAIKKKVNFIKDFAEQAGQDIKKVVSLFKDTRVFKFFKLISFNLGKLFTIVKKGFKFYTELQRTIAKYIAETKIMKFTEVGLKGLDEYLMNHPKIKRASGVMVAGLLLFIWLNIGFNGEFDFDFDVNDMIDALMGKFTLSTLFASESGIKMLLWLVLGTTVGLSFPWIGAKSVQFATAVFYSLSKRHKH